VSEDHAESDEDKPARLNRDADLLGRRNSPVREFLAKRIDAIIRGFEDQASRSDALDQWWNIFNCELDGNQYYNGDAQVYVPIIHDAVNARTTRFANQLFPQSGRYVDVTATDGQIPYEIVALINHYIRSAKFKTEVVKPLLRNGDIEGQYNLYVDWQSIDRQIVSRETKGQVAVGDVSVPSEAIGETEPIEDVSEEDISEGRPGFEVLHDSDVLVLPQTADAIEQAFQAGGSVTIVRRWSKESLEDMIDRGEIRDPGDTDAVKQIDPSLAGITDTAKKLAKAVGVRAKGPHTMAFETWLRVPLSDKGAFSKDGTMRLCRLWWGIDKEPLGLKRNPYWNDRCPLLSWPVEKIAGVFKGPSLVEPLAPLQYEANNAANERADVDHLAAMPVVARKPGENNAPLIINKGAIWDVDPQEIAFMEFPDLSARAMGRIGSATQIIFQSLSVNPSMISQQSGGRTKRNQAEMANEQSVDLLTTAEAVDVVTAGLNEAVAWMVDLDHQFREDSLTIRAFGEMGIMAQMVDVSPLRNRTQYQFAWCGAEQAKLNVAMQQQGTAFINVLRGMRQDLEAEGYKLRLGPMLERSAITIFGPLIGSQTLRDARHELSVETGIENDLMAEGHAVPVHPLDPDKEHLVAHQQYMQQIGGDPHGTFRVHITEHLMAMAIKNRAAMMQMAQQGNPGVPGGAGPGVAGTPTQGAVPAGPRQMQGPPGGIRPDNMPGAGGLTMPRRM
jgi:hypothetical protein